MSIDFNGTTSVLANASANPLSGSSTASFCASYFGDGDGELATSGVVISLGQSLIIFRQSSTQMRIQKGGTTSGLWSFPVSDGGWRTISVTHNWSADANNPTAFVDGASVTVTEVAAPVNATGALGVGYWVGNNNASAQTLNGGLCAVQIFNVLLTTNERIAACRRPGSVRRGRRLFLKMQHANDLADRSGNGFHATGTDLTTRNGPPIQWWNKASAYGAGAAAVEGGLIPPLALHQFRQRRA